MALGYTKPLYIMAFDHRASFAKTIMGWQKGELTEADMAAISVYKDLIYGALKKAFEMGVPKESRAVLVDEGTGDKVLRDARQNGIKTILTVEKSGQKEFTFQYGADFAVHIEKYKPDFLKVLINYNPEDADDSNERQQNGLKVISDYAAKHGYKLLIEPLIPPLPRQLEQAGGDKQLYDRTIRPKLEVRMMRELQDAGIEADIWKIEGLYTKSDYDAAVAQARSGGRDNVSIVILGRDASSQQVDEWLTVGAENPGVIGFAIGRTIFEEPMTQYHDKKISADAAIEEMAKRFLHFYETFVSSKNIIRLPWLSSQTRKS